MLSCCEGPQYQVDRLTFSTERIPCCSYTGSTATVCCGTVSGLSQSDIKQGKIKLMVAVLTNISSLFISSAKRNIQQKQLLSKNAAQF